MEMVLYHHYPTLQTQNWDRYFAFIHKRLLWLAASSTQIIFLCTGLKWIILLMKKLCTLNQVYFQHQCLVILFSAMPHNRWMKMTVNRGSKIKCGWIGIFNNEFTLQINTKVMKNIKTAKESLKSFSNIKNHQFKHIECSSAQMIKDAKAFERRINVFHEWRTNPWNTELQSIWSLGSGFLASVKLVKDFDYAVLERKNQIQ